jgi:hypothetical protein
MLDHKKLLLFQSRDQPCLLQFQMLDSTITKDHQLNLTTKAHQQEIDHNQVALIQDRFKTKHLSKTNFQAQCQERSIAQLQTKEDIKPSDHLQW